MAQSSQSSSGSRSRSIPIVAVIFAIVAVAAIVAVVFAGGSGEFGEPEVEGQLSPMPDVVRDVSANGQAAPTVRGANFAGDEVVISNDGRAKAIVHLAHWCQFCQREVPAVQAWLDAGGGVEGVDLYSVATSISSGRDNYPPSAWLEEEGWTVPVVVDDTESSVYRAYGAGGFPYWVFVHSDGTVALRASGSTPVEELVQIMESLQ